MKLRISWLCRPLRRRWLTKETRVGMTWWELLTLGLLCLSGMLIIIDSHRTELANAVQNRRLLQERNTALSHTVEGYKRQQALTKIPDQRIYLFSAVFGNGALGNHTIHITAWIDRSLQKSQKFSCCMRLINGSVIQTPATAANNTVQLSESMLTLVFRCAVVVQYSAIAAVSLTISPLPCNDTITSSYLRPDLPIAGNSSDIAICSKIAYGQLDPLGLLEWFEIQKYLGVTKILVHAFLPNLNFDVMAVFEHYKSIGFLELVPFNPPETDVYPRQPLTYQVFADERLTIYDCLLRVAGFGYFTTLDKDEILLPAGDVTPGALRRYLDREFNLNRNLAGLIFQTRLHLTDWGDKNAPKAGYFQKYQTCSEPIIDRSKYVAKPNRIKYWAVDTHKHSPKPPYLSMNVNPSIAVTHHYRAPRDSYAINMRGGTVATLTPRGQCPDMATVAGIVQPTVAKLLQHLNLD